ncbi:MAG: mandelate racemase/muconate lactonizing enzyme family protein [Chloroflexi bacterium]|nr:mandelate racemase/muconate lactonizing enzyme family protein [Chloroflexota bacterium]MBV9895405.1 mandelate racemase/muconate lactonizing enzyme family protein [Chloroflexota bacterium]
MMKITGCLTDVVRVGHDESITGIHIVLRLQTDAGVEGISYISRLHDAAPAALKVLQIYAERIIGMDPLAPEAIEDRLLLRGRPLPWFEARAASAIDVALWDIRGKAAGQPVYKLLGGFRDRVPCYASWRVEPSADLDKVAQSAQRHVANGFTAMKCHLGPLSLPRVVEHMRVLREAVGDNVDIMVDVNQLWSVKQAITFTRALAPYHPYWLEDATSNVDFGGLRQVSEALDIPTCAGETYFTIASFRPLIEGRCVDIVMVDQDLGLSGALKVAHMAEIYGLKVVPHLATEILAHLIAGISNGLTVEYYPWAMPLFREVPPVENGMLVLSDRPGLGLELDPDALSKYRCDI